MNRQVSFSCLGHIEQLIPENVWSIVIYCLAIITGVSCSLHEVCSQKQMICAESTWFSSSSILGRYLLSLVLNETNWFLVAVGFKIIKLWQHPWFSTVLTVSTVSVWWHWKLYFAQLFVAKLIKITVSLLTEHLWIENIRTKSMPFNLASVRSTCEV